MREDRKGSAWTKEEFQSAGALPGSVFLSNKGFEEKILNEPLPVFLGSPPSSRRREAGTWLAGRVCKPGREVSQVEQVMWDTSLGPSCGSVFTGVLLRVLLCLLGPGNCGCGCCSGTSFL